METRKSTEGEWRKMAIEKEKRGRGRGSLHPPYAHTRAGERVEERKRFASPRASPWDGRIFVEREREIKRERKRYRGRGTERGRYQGYGGLSVNSRLDGRESSAAAGPDRGETSTAASSKQRYLSMHYNEA